MFRLTASLGIHERLGRTIVALDLDAHRATDDRGDSVVYERVLLATGGRPRRLPFGSDDVVYFRTLTDFHRLQRLAEEGARFVVVGGGFIGSELAAALALNRCPVTIVFPEHGIGARVLPHELATGLVGYYEEHGVRVLAGVRVTGIEPGRVELGDGTSVEADAVVAGLGIEPNADLAETAGLPTADGIVVDELGRVGGRPDVFAAGDVARYPDAAFGGELRRVEHVDHAQHHGHCVGANMAGAATPYDRLPFFYSDLFDLGYEAVGELDSRLTVVSDVRDVHAEGTVSYLDGGQRTRGVLLWNRYGHVDEARAVVSKGGTVLL